MPIEIPENSEVRIVYAQEKTNGKKEVLFVKTGYDVTVDGNIVATQLTQEETFKIDPQLGRVFVQVRVCLPDGSVPDFSILTMSVEECLEDHVMKGVASR